MTWFADLTPYTYSGAPRRRTLNVGWLAAGQAFPTGTASVLFIERLKLVASMGHGGPHYMGTHTCDLCSNACGTGEIRAIGADGTRYAAPMMIVHYIADHDYAPPRAFIEAVLRVTLGRAEAETNNLCMSCGGGLRQTSADELDTWFMCPACETSCVRRRPWQKQG